VNKNRRVPKDNETILNQLDEKLNNMKASFGIITNVSLNLLKDLFDSFENKIKLDLEERNTRILN